MQWILMLVGLVLGWMVDEIILDALIGALFGLVIGQAFRLGSLGRRARAQEARLQQAQQALASLEQRVRELEVVGVA
ncbi:hypothetical protein, partial [Pseudomonas asplenii]